MLEKFKKFVADKALFTPEDKILLAVSGGIDSVTLADLMHDAGFSFGIAHCNFGLRGESSELDEMFVRKTAKKYKAEIHVKSFETKAFANKEKISTQMAARMLRYEWFEELLQKNAYTCIATAHHKNDVLETVLYNLVKGTGIAGLHGIQAKNGHLVRPMLFAEKEDVFDYVVEKQLIWREDESNSENKYSRNLLRNELVPILKQINPNLEETITQTVEKLSATERVFIKESERFIRDISFEKEGNLYIGLEALRQDEDAAIKFFHFLAKHHFSYPQTKEILSKLDAQTGARFVSPTHSLIKDREHLILQKKSDAVFKDVEIAEPEGTAKGDGWILTLSKTAYAKGDKIPTRKNEAFLDLGSLKFPLTVRKWKEGDWFCPLGMNKKKKLSDFFIDEKVSIPQKDNALVLLSGHSIAWIVGHRIDNRFKVGDKTTEACHIRLEQVAKDRE